MRAIVLGLGVACAFMSPGQAAPVPTDADDAALMQIEAMQDRWQGRHHYLYDDEYRPDAETMGSALPDARACAQQPVRLKRSDGSTMIKRLKRCD
jgi:hypothetical protein